LLAPNGLPQNCFWHSARVYCLSGDHIRSIFHRLQNSRRRGWEPGNRLTVYVGRQIESPRFDLLSLTCIKYLDINLPLLSLTCIKYLDINLPSGCAQLAADAVYRPAGPGALWAVE